MGADALLTTSKDTASLKFHTVFNGVSITPNIYYSSGLYKQTITGIDAITGYDCVSDIKAFFGSNASLEIQNFPEDGTISASSTTSIAIPVSVPASISMTWSAGKSFAASDGVIISSTAAPGTNYMIGTVTSYDSGTGAANIDITSKAGSGTIADWKIFALSKQLETSTPDTSLSTRPGAKDLYLQQHYRASAVGANSSFPQQWMTISRPGSATRADVEECFFSFITILPSNLATIMDYAAGANFYTFFDWKTDGYLSSGYGDYRLLLGIIRDGNGMKYRFRGDNAANGKDIPSVGSAYVPFWLNADIYGNVELDVPTRFDIYVKRPAKINTRSSTTVDTATGPRYELDLTTGISAAFRTNMDTGVSTLIHKQLGGQQMGNENLPFGRMFHGLYCTGSDGSDPIVDMRFTEFQVYNAIPASRKYLFDL